MNKSFWEKIATVKMRDILSIGLFLLAYPVAMVYKQFRRHIWLLCEYGPEARDNAYYLYKYLREEHPEVDAVYALNRDSVDMERVERLGQVVYYGGFKHWIYYLAAEVNVSSQKGGKPNAAVCYFFEVVLGTLKNRRVFLQHGIIKDDLPFLHYEKTKMSLFMCSTQKEYDFVRSTFGYPKGAVVLTGLCRYDNLRNVSDGTKVAVMPTWREWLYVDHGMEQVENTTDFRQTAFYKMWTGLIRRMLVLFKDADIKIVICMHRNMQQYNDYFQEISDKLEIINLEKGDVIDVLKEAACMISDYSSVAIDFAYLRKPLAYYQADYEQFRKHHLPEGYFDYRRDGFGKVCGSEEELMEWLVARWADGFVQETEYRARADRFFTFHDYKYCERNYEAIKKLLLKKR